MPIISSVITMCMVRTPKQRLSPEGRLCRDCLFFDAINAVPRLPLPRCDGRIKVRLRFLVSFDLHFEVLQVARHTALAHSCCIADGRTRISFEDCASSSVVRSRTIAVRFPQPHNVHGIWATVKLGDTLAFFVKPCRSYRTNSTTTFIFGMLQAYTPF